MTDKKCAIKNAFGTNNEAPRYLSISSKTEQDTVKLNHKEE